MDFLFDNPLANMPGIPFLIFYCLFAFVTLVVFFIWKKQSDKTASLPVPAIPPFIDPYEIAYLRGGLSEVARSIIFSLRQKDLLIFETSGKNSRIHPNRDQSGPANLLQIERETLNWFSIAREPKEIFQNYGGLVQVLEPYGKSYEAHLESRQFLNSRSRRQQVSQTRNIILLAILGLGCYKFIAALVNGYSNVLGIIAIAVIATLFTLAVGRLPRLTKLGRIYLERLHLAFESLKYQSARQPVHNGAPNAQFAGYDPLLLGVGIFGGSVLVGTMYDDFNQTFKRAQSQAAASTGGCGSSCGSNCGSSCSSDSSSDSSGDSGSSCSSGCGGGCGGGD
jgi:uncharacterized protein (TIGR04222 family)